jgi:hypothetical protein
MGMMKTLAAWFGGAGREATVWEDRSEGPAVMASQAPEEVVAESVPVPSLEQQAPPLAASVKVEEAEPTRGPTKVAGIKKVMIDEGAMSILDLRELPSSRFRIVGSAHWVTDSGRYKQGGNDYLLVREPRNRWDANAVAVYGKGRKVGHLTEAKAAALAPIFDELGFGAYRVGGTAPAPNSIRMWVDLPALPKLRTFAKTVSKADG